MYKCHAELSGSIVKDVISYSLPPAPVAWEVLAPACQLLCDDFLLLTSRNTTKPPLDIICAGDILNSKATVANSIYSCLDLCHRIGLFKMSEDTFRFATAAKNLSTGEKLVGAATGLFALYIFAFSLHKIYRFLRHRRHMKTFNSFVRVLHSNRTLQKLASSPMFGYFYHTPDKQLLAWEHKIRDWAETKEKTRLYEAIATFEAMKDNLMNAGYDAISAIDEDGEDHDDEYSASMEPYQVYVRELLDECDTHDNLVRGHFDETWQRRKEQLHDLTSEEWLRLEQTDRSDMEHALGIQRGRFLAMIELPWEASYTPRRKIGEMQLLTSLTKLVVQHAVAWTHMRRKALALEDSTCAELAKASAAGKAALERFWAHMETENDAKDNNAIFVDVAQVEAMNEQAAVEAATTEQTVALQMEYDQKLESLRAQQEVELALLQSQLAQLKLNQMSHSDGENSADVMAQMQKLEQQIQQHEADFVKEQASAFQVAELEAAQAAAAKRRQAFIDQDHYQKLCAENERETERLNAELAAEEERQQARLLNRLNKKRRKSSSMALAIEDSQELPSHNEDTTDAIEQQLEALHAETMLAADMAQTELDRERNVQNARLQARLAARSQPNGRVIGGHDDDLRFPAGHATSTEVMASLVDETDRTKTEAAGSPEGRKEEVERVAEDGSSQENRGIIGGNECVIDNIKTTIDFIHAERNIKEKELAEETAMEQSSQQARLAARLEKRRLGKEAENRKTGVESLQASERVDIEKWMDDNERERQRLVEQVNSEHSSNHLQLMARLDERKRRVKPRNDTMALKLGEIERRKQELKLAEKAMAKQAQDAAIEAMAAEAAYAAFIQAKKPTSEIKSGCTFEVLLQQLVVLDDVECTVEQVQILETFTKMLDQKLKKRLQKSKVVAISS